MQFPSKLVEDAVNEISKLPGIGKKTALRLVLHLLKQKPVFTSQLTQSLDKLRNNILYCQECHALSDAELCSICQNNKRNSTLVCVVAESIDMLAIENTGQYNGLYHILGGVISPINGISPEDLFIDSLLKRLDKSPIKEVIIALNATMEADTTAFYLSRQLSEKGVKISMIARGVPIGNELEYTDQITLGRSITGRVNFDT